MSDSPKSSAETAKIYLTGDRDGSADFVSRKSKQMFEWMVLVTFYRCDDDVCRLEPIITTEHSTLQKYSYQSFVFYRKLANS